MIMIRWDDEQLKAFESRIGKNKGRLIRGRDNVGEPPAPKKAKYRNVVTYVDGLRFDSAIEAAEWQKLQLREKAGDIRGLRRQVKFSLFGNGGEHIGIYTADFVFEQRFPVLVPKAWTRLVPENSWTRVVADVKSSYTRTLPAWARTKKLLLACHNITVLELP